MTTIGIIGLGYVGTPIKDWFEAHNECDLVAYDKFKNIGSVEEANKADIIFVAVPTPFHEGGEGLPDNGAAVVRGYDDAAIRESLENIQDGKIVVIKSTVVPGSTEKYQKEYPKKAIICNPEFLRAKTAREDFLKPDKQIIGYASDEGKKAAETVMKLLPKASYERIVHATEAELIKYFTNAYLATRVIFANQIYDLAETLGANYNVIKECVSKDPRIGESHLNVIHEGVRGVRGACLPKDMKALIERADELSTPLDLLKKVDEINEKLRKET